MRIRITWIGILAAWLTGVGWATGAAAHDAHR